MLVCKNRVKKPNQSLCLSCSSKQGVGEMDVLEVSASPFFEMPFLCQRLHYYLIPEYLALTKGKLGSGWSQQGEEEIAAGGLPRAVSNMGLAQTSCRPSSYWIFGWLSAAAPRCFPQTQHRPLRVHCGHSATQATTEFLNHRNNPVQPLMLVLLQFNLYFKNKIKSTFSISYTSDFPCKLILKLIHWLILHRKRILKTLNT